MSDLILKSLLTKILIQVKMTMNLHLLAQGIRFRQNKARKNVNFNGMGNYKDVDGDLDSIKLKIPNF
jgi:hypothetical protein